ncbi:hypothetical protein IF690_02205 [Pseudomonas sp. SK3(2021)]|uniref:hypothetical protein n=1 Tax=Pseudomonas sp. SK3(2021) TaxID=2841064 RepID=UPI00192B432F|nr:hypothetical protein [Pseudomonas sp. SK3(2021)]QQZ42373.1 hypothetical protein IF690_02205 [Pseudomonas sp. SK3(2021)]
MLKDEKSDTPYTPTPSYFLGGFDIYDREETLGVELEKYNPEDPNERIKLIERYCLDRYKHLSHRHKFLLLKSLESALLDRNYDFGQLLEDTPEEHSSLPYGWDEMQNPRGFFEEIFRLASLHWKEDLAKASLENPLEW